MKKKNAGVKPLQILFRGEVMSTIEKLRDNSGANSRAEVIRDAIRLYEILDEISKGKNLIVSAEGNSGHKTITIPRKKPTVF